MKPFYIDEYSRLKFPKREIYNNQTHEVWFADEDIPMLNVIRGYMADNFMIVFMNDFDIPPIHPSVFAGWFSTYKNLDAIYLGATQVEKGYLGKLTVFRGHVNAIDEDSEEEIIIDENSGTCDNLIEEATKLTDKPKIGFRNENTSPE